MARRQPGEVLSIVAALKSVHAYKHEARAGCLRGCTRRAEKRTMSRSWGFVEPCRREVVMRHAIDRRQADACFPALNYSLRDRVIAAEQLAEAEPRVTCKRRIAALAPPMPVSSLDRRVCDWSNTSPQVVKLSEEGNELDVTGWLFEANPNRYDVHTALQRYSEMRWTVAQHRDDIYAGDDVYIWASGADGELSPLG
jgi:hypothetical protein